MFTAVVLVVGHIAMAVATPAALQGMRHGTMPADYAAEHHARWRPAPPAPDPQPGIARLALAACVASAGLAAALLLAADALGLG